MQGDFHAMYEKYVPYGSQMFAQVQTFDTVRTSMQALTLQQHLASGQAVA